MNVKLAVAPIAWTNDDLPQLGGDTSLETCLSEISNIGYKGTELGGKFPQKKEDLKKILDKYNLELAGGWFSGFLLTNTLEEEIKRLDKEIEKRLYVSCKIITYCECSNTIQGNINKPISKKPILREDEIKSYAEKFSKLTKYSNSKGIILTYHHHMGTIFQFAEEIDLFLKYSSKEVGLTYDSGHYYFANEDPIKELIKHKNRIKHIHLKDVRENIRKEVYRKDKSFLNAILEGVYTIPGDGCIDFESIINILKEINYKGWIVIEAEQDPMIANPYEYSKKAYEYINTLIKG